MRICHFRTPEQNMARQPRDDPNAARITMYEIFVISVLLCGAECWTVRKVDERRIFTAEMGWLRKLGGINKRQQKKNEDIRTELNQRETLVQEIERRRLLWFGHVKRMDNSRLPAKALETMVIGNRNKDTCQTEEKVDRKY